MDFVKDFCQQFKDESKAAKAEVKAHGGEPTTGTAQPVYKKPKRALTPYLLFAQEMRKELPGMQVCAQMKEIGKRWNTLTHLQKAKYEQQSKLDKDRYEEEMAQLPKLPPSAIAAQAPKRQRCRRIKKDPNKPRKTLSPYILFVKEKRPEFTKSEAVVGKSFGEIMRMLGDMWKNLPALEKQKYYTMSEEDRERHIKESEAYEKEAEIKKLQPVVNFAKDGMPKKPLSAYLLFASETRDVLRRKTPNAGVSDIMKAISIDWAKLDKAKKRDYFDTARRNRRQYYVLIKEWEAKHGPKKDGAKQIKELEERRKKSIVSFLTHGQDFNTAAMFAASERENPEEAAAKASLKEAGDKPAETQMGSEEDDMDEGEDIDEANTAKIQAFLENQEFDTQGGGGPADPTMGTEEEQVPADFDEADCY